MAPVWILHKQISRSRQFRTTFTCIRQSARSSHPLNGRAHTRGHEERGCSLKHLCCLSIRCQQEKTSTSAVSSYLEARNHAGLHSASRPSLSAGFNTARRPRYSTFIVVVVVDREKHSNKHAFNANVRLVSPLWVMLLGNILRHCAFIR